MTHATRPSRLPRATIAATMLAVGCSTADGLDPPGGGGHGGGDGGGNGPYSHEPLIEEMPEGLDDSGGEETEEHPCATHYFHGFAYPVYANEDGLEIVSPGPDVHPLVCLGSEDVSTHGHFSTITLCGPKLAEWDYSHQDNELVQAMEAAALAQCEQEMFDEFEQHWPQLLSEYEHWLGEEEGFDHFTLSHVACVPVHAVDDPYMDYAAGWCEGYDDAAVNSLSPRWDDQLDDWDYCHDEPAAECYVPYVHEEFGERSACEVYRDQIATDIVLTIDGQHFEATLGEALVDSLLSLEVAACEYDRYEDGVLTVVDDWSIFAAVGLRDGDRPLSVQAMDGGEPTGPAYPLGEEPGQELEAFAGIFGADGERPDGIRILFERAEQELTLDLMVASAD